ncbi:MAG: class II aldolase/adducin family protein [Planctomycetaceae bacterium]|jgi:L-fuculose-phosphate aldolase|nr:class II aldolase/adducin family protein [Planctomycetaceae bacterium]
MINLQKIKEEICDIGRRLYNKGFAAANDGNISYRFDENRVVCTPTQICKGFMKTDDLCIVDMEGNQISGQRKRTSEIMLHLTIMKRRPEIKSVVHCHPPHATAFGIAREAIPQCVLPEVDIFMGDVPIAKYAIPGGQDFADTILPFVDKTNIVVQANHGTVSWGPTVERAYWLTELLDAYCRILLISRDLGRVDYFTKNEAEDLLRLKQQWNIDDPRIGMKNCELCANDVFRESWKETGVGHHAFTPPTFKSTINPQQQTPPSNSSVGGIDQEALVRAITDRVLEALNQKK